MSIKNVNRTPNIPQTSDDDVKLLGANLVRVIDNLLESNDSNRSMLASKLHKKTSSLNKLLFDLRHGTISLKNLMLLSKALSKNTSELISLAENIQSKEVEKMNIRKLILSKITPFSIGHTFELSDLLSSTWNNYSNTEKQNLGKEFNKDVLSGAFPNIRFIGKKSNNHAVYQKI